MKNMKRILMEEKPVQVLLEILGDYNSRDEDKIAQAIAHKTKTTNSHILELIGKFVESGLVLKQSKKGRSIQLSLTTKGLFIATEFKELNRLLEGI